MNAAAEILAMAGRESPDDREFEAVKALLRELVADQEEPEASFLAVYSIFQDVQMARMLKDVGLLARKMLELQAILDRMTQAP